MNISTFLNFFVNQLRGKILIKILLNYLLIVTLILTEILFLNYFLLLINGNIDNNFSFYIERLNNYTLKIFYKNSLAEIYLIILIAILILKNILTLYQNYFQFDFIFKFSVKKATNLLQVYLNKSFSDFIKKDISVYIKQITKDIESVYVGIVGLILISFGEIFYIIALIYFAFTLVDISFSIEILVVIIIIGILLNRLFVLSKKLGFMKGHFEENSYKYLGDILSLFKEIKIYEKSKVFVEKFSNAYHKFYSTKLKAGIINLTPKFIIEVGALIFLFYLFKNDDLGFDKFIIKYSVFIIALLRLIPFFSRLSSYISQIIFNLRSIEYIQKDIVSKSNNRIKKNKIIKSDIKSLKLKNINLAYRSNYNDKRHNIFKNFNYEFKKSNIYGIYGKSGSGKSSLLNLISGLIKFQKGKILINNKIIKNNNIKNRIKLSYATQENVIINDNIIINIKLDEKIFKDEVLKFKNLIKTFNLNKFLQNFNNLNNLKNLSGMSGGEKQRVNFIRAIYNNPDLILLDEPTSFLDKENEIKLFSYLKKIKKNKIIIVTSHKTNQKKFFDKVINL